MKRILFLLLIYCSLTVAVGKHFRSFYSQFFSGTSLSVKNSLFNLKCGEAETEETDSEDSEENDSEDNDPHELAQNQWHQVALSSLQAQASGQSIFKDHQQEISTPPPRF